jgi:hypothetical protein
MRTDGDLDRGLRAPRCLSQRADEPLLTEDRRIEPVCHAAQIDHGVLGVPADLLGPARIAASPVRSAVRVRLMRSATSRCCTPSMEVALELAQLGVDGGHDPRARSAQLVKRGVPRGVELRVLGRQKRDRAGRSQLLGVVVELTSSVLSRVADSSGSVL